MAPAADRTLSGNISVRPHSLSDRVSSNCGGGGADMGRSSGNHPPTPGHAGPLELGHPGPSGASPRLPETPLLGPLQAPRRAFVPLLQHAGPSPPLPARTLPARPAAPSTSSSSSSSSSSSGFSASPFGSNSSGDSGTPGPAAAAATAMAVGDTGSGRGEASAVPTADRAALPGAGGWRAGEERRPLVGGLHRPSAKGSWEVG